MEIYKIYTLQNLTIGMLRSTYRLDSPDLPDRENFGD